MFESPVGQYSPAGHMNGDEIVVGVVVVVVEVQVGHVIVKTLPEASPESDLV